MERRLWRIVQLIANMWHDGLVLDAGARKGSTAALIARTFRDRTVVTIDPSKQNVQHIRTQYAATLSNLEVHRGGVSDDFGVMQYDADAVEKRPGSQVGFFWKRNNRGNATFPLTTIDELCGERRVAFLHLDVEGMELAALRGARNVVRTNLPFFTVESHKGLRKERDALFAYIASIGYRCYEVDEICGRRDCRNNVCAPDATFDTMVHRIKSIDV